MDDFQKSFIESWFGCNVFNSMLSLITKAYVVWVPRNSHRIVNQLQRFSQLMVKAVRVFNM